MLPEREGGSERERGRESESESERETGAFVKTRKSASMYVSGYVSGQVGELNAALIAKYGYCLDDLDDMPPPRAGDGYNGKQDTQSATIMVKKPDHVSKGLFVSGVQTPARVCAKSPLPGLSLSPCAAHTGAHVAVARGRGYTPTGVSLRTCNLARMNGHGHGVQPHGAHRGRHTLGRAEVS